MCVCGGGGSLSSLGSLIKVLFVFLLIGNTLDLGRERQGWVPGSWTDQGSCSPGVSTLDLLFSPQKSCLLRGPPGVAGSPLRSVLPRDDPALALSGGNLSPFLMDPLPSPQGCNTRTQASHRTTTQDDEIHVQTPNSHTILQLAWYQTAKCTQTCVCVYVCWWGGGGLRGSTANGTVIVTKGTG